MASFFACKKTNEPEVTPEEPAPSDLPNRVVVIEEYTGINCGYCPDGHRIVNELVAQYPGKVLAVNIHAGSYAPSYYTSEGTAYMNEAKVNGFPAGAVNRHVFSKYYQKKGGIAMGRGDFAKAVKEALTLTSPVEIQATAEIDTAKSELTVKVSGKYRWKSVDADGNQLTSNSLYVMLLQDSVLGEQSGSSYNPSQVVGDQYCHMHMLRKTINGTWGEELSPVAKDFEFNKEYHYTIPATLGDDKIPTVLKDMRVLVFVAEGHKEIYTAVEPKVELK